MGIAKLSSSDMVLKITYLRSQLHFPGANELFLRYIFAGFVLCMVLCYVGGYSHKNYSSLMATAEYQCCK